MGIFDFIAPGQKNRTEVLHSTQTYLRFAEIRDNVLVLKDGGMRAILKCSSINFNLKSEEEQNAIIYSYQNFLNSLEFPIQILVRSKRLNIDEYIEQIEGLAEKQQNMLLKQQTQEYALYIKKLVEFADIMEKEFYVIVPYDPGRVQGSFGIQAFFQRLAPKDSYMEIKRRHAEFNQVKKALNQRVNIVKSGLDNTGIHTTQLNTMEIIELLYNGYNPNTSRTSKLRDLEQTAVQTEKQRIKEDNGTAKLIEEKK
ncbi:MAG: TraC family protein [Candidatus Gracilibacteria bacterium]|jgi:hypothetical protein